MTTYLDLDTEYQPGSVQVVDWSEPGETPTVVAELGNVTFDRHDHNVALIDADQLAARTGWFRSGDWEPNADSYIATVVKS
jgi:hypothetical protein